MNQVKNTIERINELDDNERQFIYLNNIVDLPPHIFVQVVNELNDRDLYMLCNTSSLMQSKCRENNEIFESREYLGFDDFNTLFPTIHYFEKSGRRLRN